MSETVTTQIPDESGRIGCPICSVRFSVPDYETWLPKRKWKGRMYYFCSEECFKRNKELEQYSINQAKVKRMKRAQDKKAEGEAADKKFEETAVDTVKNISPASLDVVGITFASKATAGMTYTLDMENFTLDIRDANHYIVASRINEEQIELLAAELLSLCSLIRKTTDGEKQ